MYRWVVATCLVLVLAVGLRSASRLMFAKGQGSAWRYPLVAQLQRYCAMILAAKSMRLREAESGDEKLLKDQLTLLPEKLHPEKLQVSPECIQALVSPLLSWGRVRGP